MHPLVTNHYPPLPKKDIGMKNLKSPPFIPFSFESSDQQVLSDIHKVIGDKPTIEFRLQFAPMWIVEKAIEKDKLNYQSLKSWEEICKTKVATQKI